MDDRSTCHSTYWTRPSVLSPTSRSNLTLPQPSFPTFHFIFVAGELGRIGKAECFCFCFSLFSYFLRVLAWRATTYLNQLCAQQYFESTSDPILDEIYDATSVISDDAISPPPKLRSIEGDPEVEAQMLLRPADIPKITSSFNLAPSVGTELLRALDQSRMRLKKELKASQKGTK